jgi:hydroxyacylglutathione hydrolase
MIDEISDTCNQTGNSAKESQRKFKSELEALRKLTSDLIGSITGTQILDLDPQNVNPKDFILIDVRKPEEYYDELGHIADSLLYTLGPDLEKFLDTADPSQKYLFICRSGGRSARAARIAQTRGFQNIFNLKGGMKTIKVLGPGCKKCKQLYEMAKDVTQSLGEGYEVIKVEDMEETSLSMTQ